MLAGLLSLLPLGSVLGVDDAACFVNPADLGRASGYRVVLGGAGDLYEQTREAVLYDNFGNFSGWIPTARIRAFSKPEVWVGVAWETPGRGLAFQIQPEVFAFTADRRKVYAPDYTLLEDRETSTREVVHRYVLSGGGAWGGFRAGLEMAYREGVTVTEQVDHLAGTRTELREGYRGYDLGVGGVWEQTPFRLDAWGMFPLSEEGGKLPIVVQVGAELLGAQTFPTHIRLAYRQERTGNARTEILGLSTRQAILDQYILGLAGAGVREGGWFPLLSFFAGYQRGFFSDLSLVGGADVQLLPREQSTVERISRSLTRLYAYLVFRIG